MDDVASTHFRLAHGGDVPFLWRMLTYAASMQGTAEDIESAETDPTLRDYVVGFGRTGDVGVVATNGGKSVGAAWVRLAPAGPISDSKVWTRLVPELAIAAVPDARGHGLGAQLLSALLDAVRGQHQSIVLSVREDNPAVRLYERSRYRVERRIVNRVGTTSLVMSRSV
ncbi:MAG: Histone acetyltransferase [Myxococcaceae bacterium]|nr:Histone acetyltransferase [Myxococcaceae bacterium]